MKAKDGTANIADIAIRTYLKMRLKLYRCYKVACECLLKPFLNLKDAWVFVILELCKPLALSTLFASASLAKKQKRTAKAQNTRKPNLHSTNEGSWMAASKQV